MRYGYILCSASACGVLSCFWLNAASSPPARQCDAGARHPTRALQIVCGVVGPGRATIGTSTRCLSRSWAFSTICGVPWIGMVSSLIFWFRSGVMGKPPHGFQASAVGPVVCAARDHHRQAEKHGRRRLLRNVEHRQSCYLDNRAENSHRPTRRRKRQMQRLKSSGQAQHFLSAHAFIHGHFHPR